MSVNLLIFPSNFLRIFLFVILILSFLKVLENEILRSYAGGTVYSLFNSDWTVRLKYVTNLVYHQLFNLYILL